MILIDNAVELVVQDRVQFHLQWDKDFPRFSAQQRRDAIGKYIDGKMKLLEKVGDISPRERQFILDVHEFRNELYHIGLRHDDIIRAMAGVYAAVTCVLFNRFQPGIVSWYTNQKFTKIARKYLPQFRGEPNPMGTNHRLLAEKLAERFHTFQQSLQIDLAKNAHKAIDAIVHNLNFLVNDNPKDLGSDQILREVQYYAEFNARLANKNVVGNWMTPGYGDAVKEIRVELKNWKPRYRRVPFANWRSRAEKINRECDPFAALAEYKRLCGDMEYLENAINEAALELDAHIQLQIDLARGK